MGKHFTLLWQLPGPSPGIYSNFRENIEANFSEVEHWEASEDCISVEDLNLDPVLRSTCNMQGELDMQLVNVTQSVFCEVQI
jgi:hypothetical protein